jgi:hypothetical protein
LVKSGAPTIREIIEVQGHASGSDNFTSLKRNIGGTGALAWNAGDIVSLRPTAEGQAYLAQLIDLQAQATNYAQDTGSANAYKVVLTPTINGHAICMPIRFQAAHTNTGPSTFNDGISTAALTTLQGAPLAPGVIIGGLVYEVCWNGSYYNLSGVSSLPFAQLVGSILNGQVPLSAVLQWAGALPISAPQITGQLIASQLGPSLLLGGAPSAATTPAVGTKNSLLATTAFVDAFVQRGIVHVGDIIGPTGGSVVFPHSFATPAVVEVSLIDANSHGASAVAGVDGIPTANGFNWAAREIASTTEDAYIHWTATGS